MRAQRGVAVRFLHRRRRRNPAARACLRPCARPASRPPSSARCLRARPRVRATCATTANGPWPTASVLWAGGRNLAAEYFCGSPARRAWLDLSFDLEGPAPRQRRRLSSRPTGPPPAAARRPKRRAGRRPLDRARTSGRTQFLPSGPDQTEDTVHALLIDALLSCDRSHPRRHALLRARRGSGGRPAARRAARRQDRSGAFPPNRITAWPTSRATARCARSGGRGVDPPAAGMNHAKAVVFDAASRCAAPAISTRAACCSTTNRRWCSTAPRKSSGWRAGSSALIPDGRELRGAGRRACGATSAKACC